MIIPAQAAETRQAGTVNVKSGRLNVRSGPSAGAGVVGSLEKDSYVTLLGKNGDWWQVEYAKGRTGYCHSDYIRASTAEAASVHLSSGSLNVRSGPGTSYARLGALANGEALLILSESGGWSRILYHGGKTGYVSSRYIRKGTNSAVSLKVPSFKQTDSRWANTYIGSSGKTMAKIGCATTAIAMMESYRTGTTCYPDAMAKQLRYTSGGSVYWPSHYTAVTSSSNYLSKIKALLSGGKPVLFGAKNASGGQHWVVVSGFSGSGNVAADFSILDPGSNSRVNLQQFLRDYPIFYKYFHY